MPSRFYLPGTAQTAPASPATGSMWEQTSANFARSAMSTTPYNTAMTTSVGGTENTSAAMHDVLIRQYVSAATLPAKQISGTFSMVIRAASGTAGGVPDHFLQLRIAIVSGDGATLRGELYAGQTATTPSATVGDNAQEWNGGAGSQATRILTVTLTPVTAQAGDRLVLELGFRAGNTSATAYTGTLWFGDDNATADYALTAGLTTTLRPWAEFSMDVFAPPGVNITPTLDVEGVFVDYTVTGLIVGTRYDVHRLQRRYVGDDAGVPQYDREYPDRLQLWSSVAHRVGWVAPTSTVTFRDYEAPLRPHSLFIVETSKTGPFEYDWDQGDYPISRGTLDTNVIHFNRLIAQHPGAVVVRSTWELALFANCCVYDMGVKYVARGSELPVIGNQYPVFVADTREARRGTLTLTTEDLGQYYDLRRIVFPANGRIRPVVLAAGGDPTLLLDDMTIVPLDVTVEQATQANADTRWVHIDYVEVNRAAPFVARAGDNDTLVNAPHANFTLSKTTVKRGEVVTVTDTSTGQFDTWDWTVERGSNNKMSKYTRQGPLKLAWDSAGSKTVKLRVSGSGAGASVKSKVVTVK